MNHQCSALYNHTNIRNGGKIYPCCRFKKQISIFDGDVDNILHSKEYVELRERFQKERISECSKCWDQEDNGIKSTRQYFNEQYNCNEIKLKNLWVGLDNICNLKCEPCGAAWSNQFTGNTITTKTLYNIPNLDKLVFLGGEPLMNKRYLKLLEKIEREDLDLTIITNGMFKPDDKWKKLWRECKHVKFFVSIDGYGDLNDKVREGSDWATIVETVENLETEWTVTINTVVHKNNVQGLHKLKEWIGNREWQVNLLTHPEKLKISEEDRQIIENNFNQYFVYPI